MSGTCGGRNSSSNSSSNSTFVGRDKLLFGGEVAAPVTTTSEWRHSDGTTGGTRGGSFDSKSGGAWE